MSSISRTLRRRTTLPVCLVIALATSAGASDIQDSDAAQGFDVSHFNHTVDWGQVAGAGFDFVYVKATEGVDSGDPNFAENWRGAADAGLARGAYHFYVTEDDPRDQAHFFISTVPESDRGELIPVVDVEVVGHGTRAGWVPDLQIFLDVVEERFGSPPMIYTGPKFWNTKVSSEAFGDYPLWIAEYGAPKPTVPAGWSSWTVWQFATEQSVEGVVNGVDLNKLPPGVGLDSIRRPEHTHDSNNERPVQDPEPPGEGEIDP